VRFRVYTTSVVVILVYMLTVRLLFFRVCATSEVVIFRICATSEVVILEYALSVRLLF